MLLLVGMSFIKTLGLRQDDHFMADNIFSCILVDEIVCVLINSWLNLVPWSPIGYRSALV